MRSLLFVPADSERKRLKAAASAADVIIYDLEDAVAPEHKAAARSSLAAWLGGRQPDRRTWIRVNEPGSRALLEDLNAIVPMKPSGIVLPKIRGPEDVRTVSDYLTMAEMIHGVAIGSTQVIAVCTETPEALMRIPDISRARLARLTGLMWGGEDLSAAVGGSDPRTPAGKWRPLYDHARAQCLLAARLLEVIAIDTVFVDLRDVEGCRLSALEARRDGFDAKVAIHPDQIGVINSAFTPSEVEVERARAIVSAFQSGGGTVAFEGKMLDAPHLKFAQRLLAEVDGRRIENNQGDNP